MDYLSITIQRFKEYVDKSLLFEELRYSGVNDDKISAKALHGLLMDFGVTQRELSEIVNQVREERKNKKS